MAIKETRQLGFADALMGTGMGRNERLDRLIELVKWYRF